jgi:threonine synthase
MPFRCKTCGTASLETGALCSACGDFVRYEESDATALRQAINGDSTAALPTYEPRITMGEGNTPMVPLDNSSLDATVHAKLESVSPTCSFKDRGSALLTSAVADTQTSWEGMSVASTGNTAPSIAAYAARAGVPCAVVVPEGTLLSKLTQVAAHDVNIYTLEGTFSDCFRVAQQASDERVLNGTAVYSANPFVASANRIVAFEIVAQLGHVPDWVTVPVGAGPLLGGTYQGFVELADAGLVKTTPRMLCVQADGCHPIVAAFNADESVKAWTAPVTTAIGAIADPLDGYANDGEATRQAVLASDGSAVALDDHQIREWAHKLANSEGIYAEPASAASVAAIETAPIEPSDTVVALITGHGLKEPGETPPTTPLVDGVETLRTAILS